MSTYNHPTIEGVTAEIDDADDAAAKGWVPAEPAKKTPGLKPEK